MPGWVLVALCSGVCLTAGAGSERAQNSQTDQQRSVDAGKALFTGQTRFKNRGPACAVCHTIAGISFPNGGSLGPDLTGAYSKLGPVGVAAALETLYFPAMTALFKAHPLTASEQQQLTAFFAGAQSRSPAPDNTPILVGIAFAGCAALLVLTWLTGRHRLKPMRQSLVTHGGLAERNRP